MKVKWGMFPMLVVSLLCSRCSLVFVTQAPSDVEKIPPDSELDCTSSKAAPIIDTGIAVAQGVRAAFAADADDSTYEDAPITREADIGFGLGLATLFAVSAAYGYSATGACKTAKLEHAQKQYEHYGPVPTPSWQSVYGPPGVPQQPQPAPVAPRAPVPAASKP